MTVSVGQPKVNKDYHSVCASKSQTDKTESYAMAGYAVVDRQEASYGTPPEFTTLKRIANRLHGQVKQSTRLTNQLHETLSAVFSELATIITNIAVPWVLTMLAKYPTAKRIAAARQSSLLKIPYLTQEKAEKTQKAADRIPVQRIRGPISRQVSVATRERRAGEIIFREFQA